MGGGCNVPVAFMPAHGNLLEIEGLVASPDAAGLSGNLPSAGKESANEAAIALADRILDRGGRAILAELM
jgi:porphobilinogen deaminase